MSKEKELNKLTTYDFFHTTALVIFGFELKNVTVVDGMDKKGLVNFVSEKDIPALSDFNIELNGETISLKNFAIKFRQIKAEIFKIIDGEKNAE